MTASVRRRTPRLRQDDLIICDDYASTSQVAYTNSNDCECPRPSRNRASGLLPNSMASPSNLASDRLRSSTESPAPDLERNTRRRRGAPTSIICSSKWLSIFATSTFFAAANASPLKRQPNRAQDIPADLTDLAHATRRDGRSFSGALRNQQRLSTDYENRASSKPLDSPSIVRQNALLIKRRVIPADASNNGTKLGANDIPTSGDTGSQSGQVPSDLTLKIAADTNSTLSATGAAGTFDNSTASSSAISAASSKPVVIPDGWRSTPRETNYYAVPVIVAMSVLVAVLVVSTLVCSALWKKKKHRRRSKHPSEMEKGKMGRVMEKISLGFPSKKNKRGGASDGQKRGAGRRAHPAPNPTSEMASVVGEGVITGAAGARSSGDSASVHSGSGGGRPVGGYRGSIAAAHARLRRRRERRAARASADDEDEDDEEASQPLTGSQADRVTPNDTLTARLAARMRSNGSNTSSGQGGPSTVFSDLDRSPSSSSGQDLSRVSSRASATSHQYDSTSSEMYTSPPLTSRPGSVRSAHGRAVIPRPASPHLSTFGSDFAAVDAVLPAPGPPAYRPATSTITATNRFSVSRVPVPRVAAPLPTPEDDEDAWHWPNEKGRAIAASTSASASASTSGAGPSTLPPPAEHDEEELPQDDVVFSAHLATDDKAVLAEIREQASRRTFGSGQVTDAATRQSSRSEVLASASAPPLSYEEEEDDDGASAFGMGASSILARESLPEPSAPSTDVEQSLLPAPSAPIMTSFDYGITSRQGGRAASDSGESGKSGGSGGSRRPAVSVEGYEHAEMGYLPVYERKEEGRDELADRNAREVILARATAPPPMPEEVEDSEHVGRESESGPRLEHREI